MVEGSELTFQRDIQPILAEHCIQCHGVDAQTREGNLRLDLRESVIKGGESGVPAIVPGKPEASELIKRITSQDAGIRMPPAPGHEPLTEKQISVLTEWIREGAAYAEHWAFTVPKKVTLPAGDSTNVVDSLVAHKLQTLNVKPSPKATSSTLCRRLYLDVTGLPPSPAELDAFEKEGFAATLDKLLSTEQYGEKWARHWLDAARYSDTNGYEKDMPREQWIWRDWVIRALTEDMPYDQFLIHQIAGDLLPNATQDKLVATGFLRNSMINEEGAIVAEQFRMFEMFDRIDCVGKSVLGISTQCAQCHSHKFDPISHDEYYGMFGFLNNTFEAQSWIYTADQLKQIQEIRNQIASVEQKLRDSRPAWQQEFQAWQTDILNRQIPWTPLDAVELGSISGLNHPTQDPDKSIMFRGHTSADVFMISQPELTGVTGLRFEALLHKDMPFMGPGRSKTGTWGITEVEAFVQKPDSKDWEKLKLVNATADFSEVEQKEDKKIRGPVNYLIDGSDETSWEADRGVGRRNRPSVAVVQFEQPLQFPAGTRLKIAMRMNDMLGCCRISTTTNAAPAASAIDYSAIMALQTQEPDRTSEQQASVFSAWRESVADLKSYSDEIEKLWQTWPTAPTSVLHLAERPPEQARATHLLDRGNWDQPRQAIEPHVPAAFHALPESSRRDRLAFAEWLADERSPLTARVAVNRVWQAIFGQGLVETSEDFGTRAAAPEYQDLLDWLAVDLMEHNWSQKHLIRTILSSATYQQSSHADAALLELDPRNQLLTRGPRFRAEAEIVRDIALSASGLLTQRVGGPGIIPPVPQNVLDYNFTYPAYWIPTTAPERYRRTVYVFRKRSMPDPVLSNFDAPNSDFSCARRVRSNTPLAALTGLNEIIFVESAQAMALRVLREGGRTDAERTDYAFRLCTSRWPVAAERNEILTLLQSQRKRLSDGWLNIREIATGDSSKLPALPEGATPQDAAAWTLVCRVILNLDETISKN
jgi:hypothetical protein